MNRHSKGWSYYTADPKFRKSWFKEFVVALFLCTPLVLGMLYAMKKLIPVNHGYDIYIGDSKTPIKSS